MNLKTAIAIAVAAAFAVPLAAQASADADKIIVAQQSGGTMQPKDSNPAAPPATFGPGKNDSSTTTTAPKAESDRPASGAAAGSSTAPITGGTNSADRKPNTPKAEAGATARGGFAGIDKNNDGYISRDEARDATWENRFSELDKDNDNRLSQSEFDAMQAGAASGTTGAPVTSGSNSADRKPNTPKQ
ncbi:MAG TPA: EF-hand domain-containing protein [Burkholderiales bacterium]